MQTRKRKPFQENLAENIGKPKEILKIIKKWFYQTKRLPEQRYAAMRKKRWHFPPEQSQTFSKNILRILQVILLRNFFTLQENLQYCTSITTDLTSVKKKLKFEKGSSVLILKISKEFKTSKTTGIDHRAGRFLKDGSNTPYTLIAKICTLFIKLASFPDKCKIAKIKPWYKKGLKTDPENFRIISLLPLMSKIIEWIIHDQTMNFLSDNNVLYKLQSAFRKFHSTSSCLSYLYDKITKGFDSGLLTGVVLIDLQKAFDTIDDNILI